MSGRFSNSTPPADRLVTMIRWARHGLSCLTIAACTLPGALIGDEAFFTDVTRQAGIDFTHESGKSGALYFAEMAGPGGALLDYDGDGDLDLYLVQGGPLDAEAEAEPVLDRLFRNDTKHSGTGPGALRFTDVTAASGIKAPGYGMAAAAGDYDGDGHVDLYVANLGANQLWRNRGDGTFEDKTAASGTAGDAWSSGALFFDADGDGALDLYVIEYVDFRLDNNIVCYATSSRRDYCGPQAYNPVSDHLYLSRGDGTFEDATTRLLTRYHPGSGLGAAAFDADGDGDVDLFVANDGEPNQLWLRQADGTYIDEALLAGVALNAAGQPEASMGVAVADPDHDGDLDLFITHLTAETNTFYENLGDGLFEDRSVESGLGAPSLPLTGFGTGWLDLDGDARLDLAVVNGAVRIQESLAGGDRNPLEQRHQLFRQRDRPGRLSFEDVSSRGGGRFAETSVGRGLLLGDLDNDGDTDLVLIPNHAPASVLRNRLDPKRWLGLSLVDRASPAAAVSGATVAIHTSDGRTISRRAAADGSYAASSDPRVHTAVPAGAEVTRVVVTWPGGARETFPAPTLGRYTTLRRGAGIAPGEKADPEPTAPAAQDSP